jgi:hypothetical protein
MGGGGWGGSRRVRVREETAAVELCLDLAIFEDGLCIGPDEFGLFDRLIQALKRQRSAVQDAVTVLRKGGSVGQVFEVIRQLADGERDKAPMPILGTFLNICAHMLMWTGSAELLAWFESFAEACSLPLRRPL